jgi:glutamine amidotransferase
MQLLGESSTENGFNSGLGLVRGVTKHLSTLPGLQKKERIPRMGWYEVSRTRSGSIGDLPDKAMLYFAHSYYMEDVPIAHQLLSSTFNNVPFCVGIRDQSIVGLQFHPEKSGELGLSLLEKILSSNG